MREQFTVRLDDRLAREIEDLARREGISRNHAVVGLLRKATGLHRPEAARNSIGDSLDWFIGSWTDERADELNEAVTDFETVDEALWK
jgi:metal-responsive CopG/Arc/MetJ family transcriptional regulator